MGRYFALIFASAAMRSQRGVGLSQRRAILEAPRGLEIIRIIGRLAMVETHDALDRISCRDPSPPASDKARSRSRPGVRTMWSATPRAACRYLFSSAGRHGQRFAGVVEARRIGRIHRKLPRRLHVLAGQVADGVVVFRVAQPAGQHRCPDRPRSSGSLPRARPESRKSHSGALRPACRAIGLGGISFAVSRSRYLRPARIVLGHRVQAGVRLQIELRRGRFAAMAANAIFRDKRPHGLLELPVQRGRGGQRGDRSQRERDGQSSKLHDTHYFTVYDCVKLVDHVPLL